jgi:2-dehydro-3-deoxygluconokinase
MKIAIIGECMIELFDQGNGSFKRTFGGDTLNSAIYLSKCSKNIDCFYITILGDDPLSNEMIKLWEVEGIKTNFVEQIANSVPGLYMIQTDEQGERSFLYWRDNAPAKKLFLTQNKTNLINKLKGFDWIYFSGISLAILEEEGRKALFELLKDFRQSGGKVAFDNNYRPKLWEGKDVKANMQRAYENCDIALPSIDDEFLLWGDDSLESVKNRLIGFDCGEIVIKRGSDSCIVYKDEKNYEYKIEPITNIVDTTAAGDSFNGAYLAKRLEGVSIEDSIKFASKVAGQVIGQKGAIVPINI